MMQTPICRLTGHSFTCLGLSVGGLLTDYLVQRKPYFMVVSPLCLDMFNKIDIVQSVPLIGFFGQPKE